MIRFECDYAEGAAPQLLERLTRTNLEQTPGYAVDGHCQRARDLIRAASDGEGMTPHRVGVADERGEVAALCNGIPQLEVGRNTHVVEGCPKAQGLMLLLRAMNPQVLAVDEAGGEGEILAMKYGMNCGCRILATVHGADVGDIMKLSAWRELAEAKVFCRYVLEKPQKYVIC